MKRTALIIMFLFLSLCSIVFASDLDNDGIDDSVESILAEDFLPLIYFSDQEECPSPGVILYHVRPFAPGIDSIISVTYVLLFYKDCGAVGHDGDAETLCLTLFEDPECQNGYRVHSMRTFAHEGVPVCGLTSSLTADRCDFGASAGDYVYASRNKHALYRFESTCNDPDRWFCYDECDDDLLMNNGTLVYPGAGQAWFMYNVGEPDYPLLTDLAELNDGYIDFASTPVWDYQHFCGDEQYDPGDYCPAFIANSLFHTAPGPTLSVEVSFSEGGAVPSPMGFCRNQFLFLDLPYGGNVIAHIYDVSGEVVDKVFLPYFCAAEDFITPYWDGGNLHGYCASPGNYYLVVEAQRGDDHAETEPIRFGIVGDEGRPNGPTGLEAAVEGTEVTLTWMDQSDTEEAYIVERSFDTCPYRVIAILPANSSSYFDNPVYEGTVRYRVMAHRTMGGNSPYSNEVELALLWDADPPILSGTESQNPHLHSMRWHFDPGEAEFDKYILYKRWRVPQGFDNDGGKIPPNWSQWFYIFNTSDLLDTVYVDSALVDGNCYEYRVSAVVHDEADTLTSNTRNFHGNCESKGCPVLSIMNGTEEKRLTNIFPALEYPQTVGSDPPRTPSTDVVHIGSGTSPEDSLLILRIEEVGDDTTFLDDVSLVRFERPDSLSVGITPTCGIIFFEDTVRPQSAFDRRGVDLLDQVTYRDGVAFPGSEGDLLVVEFTRSSLDDTLFGILDLPEDPPDKAFGPTVSVWDERAGGGWVRVCTLHPHQSRSTWLLNLAPHLKRDQSLIRLKVEWTKPIGVDALFLTSEVPPPHRPVEINPFRSISADGIDLTDDLSGIDNAVIKLENGQHVTLYFKQSESSLGRNRNEYFLLVKGWYEKGACDETP